MAKAEIILGEGSGGGTSYEIVPKQKSAGSNTWSIPTSKKADNFIIAYPNSSSAAALYAFNKETSKLEYWNDSGHGSSYDISVTATFNTNSIDLTAFQLSASAKNCVVIVIYAE